jgi:hypothetical protein
MQKARKEHDRSQGAVKEMIGFVVFGVWMVVMVYLLIPYEYDFGDE